MFLLHEEFMQIVQINSQWTSERQKIHPREKGIREHIIVGKCLTLLVIKEMKIKIMRYLSLPIKLPKMSKIK